MRRTLVAAISVAMSLLALPAHAATPSAGTLSKATRSLSWTGGPFAVTYPTSDFECLQGASDPLCDHYHLSINMGQGAKIKISAVASSSGLEILQGLLVGPNDVDLYVYDPDGNLAGSSDSTTGKETVTLTTKSKFRNKPYEVRIVPFIVLPGATYTGKAVALSYVK